MRRCVDALNKALLATVVSALLVACGLTSDEEDDDQPPNRFSQQFGQAPAADLYANDPPPQWCGPEGAAPPPPASGTEACPDDKNKPGCACSTIGATAPCWTGLRRHRNLGICQDGVTTCIRQNELLGAWGPCEGEVLPKPGASGREACGCFSRGEWKITNTTPCLRTSPSVAAMSTVYQTGPSTNCGLNDAPVPPIGTPPPGVWSPSTLKVDCAGNFRLCFRIRAGDPDDPRPTDCVLGEACTDADYTTPDVEQPLPDLPTWAGRDAACAKRWEIDTPPDVSPGYAEMIVKGRTQTCESVDDGAGNPYVFHRIPYCPRMCRAGANATHPSCVECQRAGRGVF